jgi:AAA family ATP:ADP antiporter
MRLVAHDSGRPSLLEKILSMFAEVHPGEGVTALLLMANVFTLLTAYYIIKPVREALILGESSAEIKSYASAGQAALLLLIIPLYGLVAKRVNRVWLINGITAFSISNLFLFFALGQLGAKLGVVFYLWVGLFNVMIIAQFWSFANDLYSKKKGERLFGLIGIGASIGAILGAAVARRLFEPIGVFAMMLVAAAMLVVCMILTATVNRREKGHGDSAPTGNRPETAEKPMGSAGGFQLIFANRYLLAIAFLVLLSNFVNTTGEFILGKTVETHAEASVAPDAVKNYIGQFYSDFYFWVNLMGAVVQMFLVSRIMQYLGTGAAVLFLPILALGSYAFIAWVPILSWIRLAKIAENTTDYSVQNTARHALFLPTSREAKYKAKTAVDSFFWRTGDALSGLLVFVGTRLAMTVRGFAVFNIVLVGIWLVLAVMIARSLKQSRSAAGMAA